MSDSLINNRSFKLQNSLSKDILACLPDGTQPVLSRSFNKHQRFKVFEGKGRVEEEFVNVTMPQVYDSCKLKGCDSIAHKKAAILEKWNEVIAEEKSQAVRAPESKICQSSKEKPLRIEPSWLRHDKQVLCFNLLFKEELQPPSNERLRIRTCSLLYYLCNDKIEIKERREENSGIVQGSFLKPIHLFKKDGTAYCPEDFVIGRSFNLLGRYFTSYGCDNYTRDFLSSKGIFMEANAVCPVDDHHKSLKIRRQDEDKAKLVQKRQKQEEKRPDTLQQFLDNDRKVLRFYCVWDDNRQFGLKNRYVLHFFLSDNTVEIRNLARGKQGTEIFPLMFKRQRLVKNMKSPDSGYVLAADLICGQFIDVLTRKLLLESCDSYTKEFYLKEYQIKQPTVAIPTKEHISKRQMVKSLPPYNGFGSEKDSLANCFHLIPKPVKQDLKQFLKYQGKKLQFVAKFTTPSPGDENRRFVITYFMDDDSCEIYESAKSTPGILGGKFLERGKYKIPTRRVETQKSISKELRKLQETVQEKIKSRMNGGPFGLLRAFRQFAINENCMIDHDGFKIGLRTIGIVVDSNDKILQELFSLYDRTGDGQIDFQEFVDNVMEEKLVPSNLSDYAGRALRASDLYVGGQVKFLYPQSGACSPEFSILKATKRTLALMESKEHVEHFPKSNVEVILKNLAVSLREFNIDVGQLFRKLDRERKGYVDVKVFGDLLQSFVKDCSISDYPLTEHEVLTLTRIYDVSKDGKIDFKEFSSALNCSVALVDRVRQEAARTEKAANEAYLSCMKQVIENIHKMYDRSGLIQKFSTHCKSHKLGIPQDLFLFFLTDEIGAFIDAEFYVEVMLTFDRDCDGRISVNDFIESLYREEASGEVEKSINEVLALNRKQTEYHKPGFAEYKTKLKSAQLHTFSSKLTLETLIKGFTSAFFKKRKDLLKAILTFDYERTGYITEDNLYTVLYSCNLDYPPDHLTTLLKFLFQKHNKLEYQKFLELFFAQSFSGITETFGSLAKQ